MTWQETWDLTAFLGKEISGIRKDPLEIWENRKILVIKTVKNILQIQELGVEITQLSGSSLSCISDICAFGNEKVTIRKDFSVLNSAKRSRKNEILLHHVKCRQNKHLQIKPHQNSFTVSGETNYHCVVWCHLSWKSDFRRS